MMQAAYHMGDSTLWNSLAAGGAEQAATWLGDIGPVLMLVVGAGLLMMIVAALLKAIKK